MQDGQPELPQDLEERIAACKRAIQALGVVLRGSITTRYLRCGKKGCRCQGTPPALHGPYYQWSRKLRGKTVSVRITSNQARVLRAWVANSRRLDQLVGTWEAVGLKAMKLIPK